MDPAVTESAKGMGLSDWQQLFRIELPLAWPVIIAGVRGNVALLQSTPDEPMARFWVSLLVFFDVVFVTLALWTFEPLMTE